MAIKEKSVEDLLKDLAASIKDSKFDKVGVNALQQDIKLKTGEIARLDGILSNLRKEKDELTQTILAERKAQIEAIEKRDAESKAKNAEAQANVESSRKAFNEARVEKQKVTEVLEAFEKDKAEVQRKLDLLKEISNKLG